MQRALFLYLTGLYLKRGSRALLEERRERELPRKSAAMQLAEQLSLQYSAILSRLGAPVSKLLRLCLKCVSSEHEKDSVLLL
jgi:hypothetical protein